PFCSTVAGSATRVIPPMPNAVVRELDPTVLSRTLERAREKNGAGVVVFDLDSTLLDNRPRQARILREFGLHAGLAALTGAKPEDWQDWDIRHAMANAGLGQEEI